MKRYFVLFGCSLLFASCATSTAMDYKEVTAKERFGYKEVLQEDGSYILSVILPGAGPDRNLPFEFWDRRAAELCGEGQYEKNIYKAYRPTQVTQGAYVYGGVGLGGGAAGAFTVEGKLTCLGAPENETPPEVSLD